MSKFYCKASDGTRYQATLLSLDRYEEDGGRYDDSGNGGERCGRGEFVAAIVVQEKDGEDWTPAEDMLHAQRALGVPAGALWHDSASGWFLLRDWPAEAPLDARMLNS